MNEWLNALAPRPGRGIEGVLVTVASGRGSTPRDAGVKMLVTADAIHGTVGGGELEFQAMGIARELLAKDGQSAAQRFALGADFGQNCGGAAHLIFERVETATPWVREVSRLHEAGQACVVVTPTNAGSAARIVVSADAVWGSIGDAAGDALAASDAPGARDAPIHGNAASPADAPIVAEARRMLADREHLSKVTNAFSTAPPRDADPDSVTLLFDPILPSDFRILLFGAGHVGKALARVLGVLSCEVTWTDSRANEFPEHVPGNVRTVVTDQPQTLIAQATPGTYFLTMTHSHATDFAIVEAVLSRGDFAYCGMIGSSTKRRTFENGLTKHGVAREALARFTCPIGMAGINGKEPGAIAIAVAAQLVNEYEAARGARAVTVAA